MINSAAEGDRRRIKAQPGRKCNRFAQWHYFARGSLKRDFMKSIKFSKAANEHKHAIAELLYSDDKAFVPITPLLGFDASEFYYATASDASDDIRACSSYQLWLEGLETPNFDERLKIPVYELSSSLVRSPLGGFGACGP
jgi:hypothetical protein